MFVFVSALIGVFNSDQTSEVWSRAGTLSRRSGEGAGRDLHRTQGGESRGESMSFEAVLLWMSRHRTGTGGF
ncbi:hypothetical protein OJAV_G00230330 [Oryzias javanicus]|uniref:Uncharacterized protein n=1 Tax=Oryzias javanicus TaxID=123683 RepID=A0A437BZC4_ORYJA|nr:hypothetical protein OJAV_G00230330 [Oryzias javanicus]